MNAHRLRWLFLSLLICLSGCCTDHSHDAQYRRDARSQTDYVVGAVYRLKKPLFATKADLWIWGTYYYTILERVGANQRPTSLQEYEQRQDWWEHEGQIAGVAGAGTLIRITDIQFVHEINRSGLEIYGRMLLDAPWAKKPAYLNFISKKSLTHGALSHLIRTIPVIDRSVLEPVTP